MDDRIEKLMAAAREGGAAEGRNLGLALRDAPDRKERLIDLADATDDALRVASATAAVGLDDAQVFHIVDRLASDGTSEVREAVAKGLKEFPTWPVPSAVIAKLLKDEDEDDIRRAVLPAAVLRDDLTPEVQTCLEDASSWQVRESAAKALIASPRPQMAPHLLARLSEDGDVDVRRASARALERIVAPEESWPEGLTLPEAATLRGAKEKTEELKPREFPVLLKLLEEAAASVVDLDTLRGMGRDLTAQDEAGQLPDVIGLDDVCDRVIDMLDSEGPRAIAFLGDPGTGKTAAVYRLVERLRTHPDGPWMVLRVSPPDILVGTLYLGEWQTKLQKLIDNVRRPRKVLLYVPDVHQLLSIGVTSKSDVNATTLLSPYLENGEVAILGESTPDGFRAGLAGAPSFQRLFQTIDFKPASPEETREIALAVCAQEEVEVEEATIERLIDIAGFCRQGTEEPGRTVGLLRRVLEDRRDATGPLTDSQILETVQKTTGVPPVMVDDARALGLEETRRFLEERVMGQPEAVNAMLDVVTLIKAGLTDPSRPFGVFLFVGPTGVGKTELARALGELLFGHARRIHRFDMSEYASYNAFERLLGAGNRPGLLTGVVQDEPFSVILLDEIEKAHVNVFDLCLQIFDAGRLTDTRGRTADFRRTIVILTSNVGSAIPTEQRVGFGDSVDAGPDRTVIERQIRQTFRPEFLGRLDAIVHFQALAMDTAERIARRELDRVLERSGILRRQLQVDVDPAILTLLLQEGYSPVLGARPLKRTIERRVLMPLARALAEARVPRGSIVRLLPRGKLVGIEIDRSEAEDEAEQAPAKSVPKGAADFLERVDRLVDATGHFDDRLSTLDDERRSLLAASRAKGFWDAPDEARRVLSAIHQSEALLTAVEDLRSRMGRMQRELSEFKGRFPRSRYVARMEALERDAHRLGFLLETDEPVLRGDAFVVVARVAHEGKTLEGVEKIGRMLARYAERYGLDVTVLSDRQEREGREDELLLHFSGLGAYALFSPEFGLHQLRLRKAGTAPRRALVRVSVWPEPGEGESPRPSDHRVKIRPLRKAKGRLIPHPKLEVSVLHASSLSSVTAWTALAREEAINTLCRLLQAQRGGEHTAESGKSGPVVRRYDLGTSPRVRDQRSGRTTGRLDEVLDGDLDRVRAVASAPKAKPQPEKPQRDAPG